MKQHTASISSGEQVVSTHTVNVWPARSLARTSPRLPISSSSDWASLSETLLKRTRNGRPAAVDAAAGWGAGSGSGSGSGAATGAGAAAAGACPPSSASWRNTAQMRSNTASSGSSEAR
ncbi:Uncharacterised protein [Bordetella pertussis]|nr:Uncharacterised protein [Bordetella pertussis]